MGVLKQQGTDRCFAMGPRCVIGRHDGCHLRVDRPHISSEHADLRWQRDHWELHDMGSKNGTFLEGRRLDGREHAPLFQGARFTLGPDLGFTLIDDSPPAASARNARTFAVRTAQDGILVLPDDEHPEASIFEDANGHWVAEGEDASRRVADGEEIVAGGDRWKLTLTSAPPRTETLPIDNTIDTIKLRIVVNPSEENVELVVLHGGRETKLESRVAYYVVLTLARARLADADASPGERGWVDRDVLLRMLGPKIDAPRLNVDVFRVRRQFTELNIHGAANIIERRAGTGELRLGIDQVEVVKL